MELEVVLKNLEAQHANKLKEINQLEQALSKAQSERLKIEGAYEVTKMLLDDKSTPVVKEDVGKVEDSTGDTVGKVEAE